MRTTVTLDPDVEAIVQRLMSEQGLTFKAALNQAVRAGAAPSSGERVEVVTRDMGRPLIDVDRALSLVGELEDDETLRKLRLRK